MPIASEDPDADYQPPPKAYAILLEDPFYLYWSRKHYDTTTTLIESNGLDWTSIGVVRYGVELSALDNPVCVLITITEESPEEFLGDTFKLQLQSIISDALWPMLVCRVSRGITYIAHDRSHSDHFKFVVEIIKRDVKHQTKVYTAEGILW